MQINMYQDKKNVFELSHCIYPVKIILIKQRNAKAMEHKSDEQDTVF